MNKCRNKNNIIMHKNTVKTDDRFESVKEILFSVQKEI